MISIGVKMKEYKVTMFEVVENVPYFYSINVTCQDVATEIWLNSEYKNVWDVTEIQGMEAQFFEGGNYVT